MDALEIDEETAWDIISSSFESREVFEFAIYLVRGTHNKLDFIDKIILENTDNWEMDRIAKVDRAIIRMGFYEIFFEDTIPRNAAINEAVELAKYFSTEKSHKFVNGILDTGSKNIANDR